MNIITNFLGSYDEDPVRYFDFQRFENNISKDIQFFYGNPPSNILFEKNKFKKILLTLEEQISDDVNFKDPGKTYVYEEHVDKILTLIPTRLHNLKKREYVFFPFNRAYIPKETDKKYDVCYTGFAKVDFMVNVLKLISQYDYAYVSFKENITWKSYLRDPKKYLRKKLNPNKDDLLNMLINFPNRDYRGKLEIVSKSKASIVHNLLDHGMPQLKSRSFESAFCKSLMLVYKDDHNVINDWFEEDKHFIFFENTNDLKEKLDYIISNYPKFQGIIENAYEHALNNYTVENFVNKYLR